MSPLELDGRAELQARQAALLAALASGRGAVPGLCGLGSAGLQRGLQAYRSNAQALAARALAAVYGPLHAWLGEASFAAMAWAFWRASPPQRGDLAEWGADLADFLARQPQMEALPCQLARLCWAAHRAEGCADGVLDGPSLHLLAQLEPARLGLRMRPGLSLQQISPAALLLWRGGAAADEDLIAAARMLSWVPQPLLVWRQAWTVQARFPDPAEAVLLQALLAGLDLDTALQSALLMQPDYDFGVVLQRWLREECLWAALEINAQESP
ncbi:hypothetical protein HNP55_000035 [Paucibacter oligotrophus]|uniref:Putative DNA-binding domain-containing protein n=1 Tax=Roseateles oligotrophus TaxID=1769250 RepID=A0A840KZW7_9BURK|nr:putative DNA-binding domain-containing protein [Roseateles oligotrophus]MBB4841540.1 hypothetical protein [Roseateles oligotrophus]